MDLRILTEPQQGASYDTLLTLARAAEDLGFDGFFRSDHYLAMGPAEGLAAGPPAGRPGPTDAWITLAGLARETRRIRLGTLVSPVTFRLPGPFSVQVAQIDAMSGGRVELGLGAGWYEAEHTAYGIGFPDKRFGLLEEQLRIITGLWNTPDGESYSFEGEHYRLRDCPALPKPLQRPHPPIIVGGFGLVRTPRLAARYADEYNFGFRTVTRAGEAFARARAAARDHDRSARPLVFSAAATLVCGRTDAEVARRAAAIGRAPSHHLRANGLVGTPAQVVEKIAAFQAAGASRLYLQLLDLQDLDHLELVAAQVARQLD